jgi:hypothetical protein
LSSPSAVRFDPSVDIGTSVDNGGDTADEDDDEADEAGCWDTVDDDGGDCDNGDEDDDAVAADSAARWL